jgi:hypothetical protein
MSDKKLTEEIYAPIRERENGAKWIDCSTGDSGLEMAKELTRIENGKHEIWAKYNPVVGYARCKVSVVEYIEED